MNFLRRFSSYEEYFKHVIMILYGIKLGHFSETTIKTLVKDRSCNSETRRSCAARSSLQGPCKASEVCSRHCTRHLQRLSGCNALTVQMRPVQAQGNLAVWLSGLRSSEAWAPVTVPESSLFLLRKIKKTSPALCL